MRGKFLKINLEKEINQFIQGENYYSYKFMGAHLAEENGVRGYRFTLWAPRCKSISVVGDFNNWDGTLNTMVKVHEGGIWSTFIEGLEPGEIYKYEITHKDGKKVLKADPYGFYSEKRPNTASILVDSCTYPWGDGRWIGKRRRSDILNGPVNIYELHLGSFIKESENGFLNYKEIGQAIINHVKIMGYTHIEIMPITEYPLDDSWGYQVTGYFSPTSRYGTIEDLKWFIDHCHRSNIGIILDWVPGHFCKDQHGLFMFDGTPQYEYDDFKMYNNPGWGTANFNLSKTEVRNFLISSAIYWIKEFHFDGIRIDAVSNMVYLDFCKGPGQWLPNEDGGNVNYGGKKFLRLLNEELHNLNEGIITIAEESTALAYVTSKEEQEGLGFDLKWNMGWMNDTLKYVELQEEDKKFNHNLMNFSMMYAYYEKFMLAISHDEVVYGKKSLFNKMPGDRWQKFAALRCYLTFMYCHPGKKTLFMGSEFGQFSEWYFKGGLDFHLMDMDEGHKNTLSFTKELNNLYKGEEALWKLDFDPKGFKWIDPDNNQQRVLSFIRYGEKMEDTLIIVCNFAPITYYDFKIGVPYNCCYKEVFNSDEKRFGGAGEIMSEVLFSVKDYIHGMEQSITIKVPPLGAVILKVNN
ncbi:MAG: 1,4-alpha-glucan branching protein GlgB [Clostridium sp.]|nr:1,4-alpha-glucan branching protein GlgB [Clostridium sp.]MDU7084704.1 1,4-alpha-glucan branching protein GlgB [Clostridium sp.]